MCQKEKIREIARNEGISKKYRSNGETKRAYIFVDRCSRAAKNVGYGVEIALKVEFTRLSTQFVHMMGSNMPL